MRILNSIQSFGHQRCKKKFQDENIIKDARKKNTLRLTKLIITPYHNAAFD